MIKTQLLMNKPVYLGLSILDLSKNIMYEFWYDYVKPKYREKAKLCYIDTDSFIVHMKAGDIYKDIAKDVETRFDTSNYELERPLTEGKNKQVVGLIKEEQKSRSKKHNFFTEEINKISLKPNDDKKILSITQ